MGEVVTGWLKLCPKERWVRIGGRVAILGLQVHPKVKWAERRTEERRGGKRRGEERERERRGAKRDRRGGRLCFC